jgi:hypothetical protein
VRFIAPPSTSVPAAPHAWTTRVTLTLGPPERAQFAEETAEATIVASYSRILPAATGGSIAGA